MPSTTTRTSTPSSTVTSTPPPTLPPPENIEYTFPLPDSDLSSYQLTQLDSNEAIELKKQLEGLWESILENSSHYSYLDAYNPLKKNIALIGREILWRFPDIQFRQAIEWSIARNLAQGGDQSATAHLAILLKDTLNSRAVSSVMHLPDSFHPGFDIEVEEVSNLYNEGDISFIVVLKLTDDSNNADGGSVFVIRPSSSGNFEVHTVYGYWQPYFSSEPYVIIGDHTADGVPEIYITQEESHGGGISMTESWVCGYQWVDDDWVSILRNAISEEQALSSLEALDSEGCLVVSGIISLSWISQDAQELDQMIVLKNDTYQCSWSQVEYRFDWQVDEYSQSASMAFPDQIEFQDELYCLSQGWSLMDQFDDLSDLIDLMENTLPELVELMSERYSPSYVDRYSFYLGRAYALSGDSTKAERVLSEIYISPNDPNGEWKDTAEQYLALLPNIEEAEGFLRSSNNPPATSSKNIEAQDATSNGADLLFVQRDSESAIEYLESIITNSTLVAFGEYACSGPVDPDFSSSGLSPVFLSYRNYCASVKYILAIAYEAQNQDSLAAKLLYEIWEQYPETFYAFIARQRLELQ